MSMAFIHAVRPDGTLIWLPAGMAGQLGVGKGERIGRDVWEGNLLQALLTSREAANRAGAVCDAVWHRKNGYE